MISSEDIKSIDKGMITIKIIWAAMLFSLAIYLFVGLYARDQFATSIDESIIQTLRNVLYGISIITLVAAKFIRNILLKSTFTGRRQGTNIQHPALARYSTAMIVSLALSESIGIYGLILAFLGSSTTDLYLLLVIAAAAMIHFRPKKEEVVGIAQQLNNETANAI
jgi:hypothetical protein